ncbi:MAG TPA: cytochrome b/b6 domain-containing protein [Burkholderiaceae bacterium]
MPPVASKPAAKRRGTLYLRHTLGVRVMHWVNVLSLTVLLMSGLMIFNAHPALDWGKSSYTGRASFLRIASRDGADGRPIGVTTVLGREFETTGVLGVSTRSDGRVAEVAFPSWITIPGHYSLAEARAWHFFFAWVFVLNGLAYVIHAVLTRHLARDLLPTRSDWRGIGQSIRDHLTLRHPTGEAAWHYNVLQKVAYLVVIFVLLPLIILAGWAMSPWLNSLWSGWVDLFGGRQSARSVHFIAAWALVGFVVIHVFEVIVSGLWNHLRSMITGRFRVTDEPEASP